MSSPKKKKPAANSVESDILESLSEFTEALKANEVTTQLTCRKIRLDLEPTHYNSELVKETREILRVSQVLFAKFLGISPKTVRSWEQGQSEPNPMACRFMDEIRENPTYWRNRLKQEATVKTAGC